MCGLTDKKGVSCYDLKDAAYDAPQIWEYSRKLGHVPIIDRNKRRRKDVLPKAPHEANRYKERTVVERFNASLKDTFGARFITVKGYKEVALHLMLGITALFASKTLQLIA